jgi:hypothetical protein
MGPAPIINMLFMSVRFGMMDDIFGRVFYNIQIFDERRYLAAANPY